MPTGLRIPVGVDGKGRASVETDQSKNTLKNLKLAFSEGDDDNPFQDLGLKGAIIFSINNPAFRAKALRAIQQILDKYSELVELDESKPITFRQDEENEVIMEFTYIDLLTRETKPFSKKLGRNQND